MTSLPVVTAVAGIIWQGGQYLMACRPAGKIMAGYWEFPGGKVENGETPRKALGRELREELGIICRKATPCTVLTHAYPHGLVTLHLFHVTRFAGNPAPLEGQVLRWIDPARPPDLCYLPVNVHVVQALQKGPSPFVKESLWNCS